MVTGNEQLLNCETDHLSSFINSLQRFFSGQEEYFATFERPQPSGDTNTRKAMRLAQILEIVVDYSGIQYTA
jgi:hypothetical protein